MRKVLLIAWPLALTTLVFAAAKQEFKTGKLLDVTTETKLVDGSSYRWAVFVVQIDDFNTFGEAMMRKLVTEVAYAGQRAG